MRPSGARAMTSVKVPPRSIQKCHPASFAARHLEPRRRSAGRSGRELSALAQRQPAHVAADCLPAKFPAIFASLPNTSERCRLHTSSRAGMPIKGVECLESNSTGDRHQAGGGPCAMRSRRCGRGSPSTASSSARRRTARSPSRSPSPRSPPRWRRRTAWRCPSKRACSSASSRSRTPSRANVRRLYDLAKQDVTGYEAYAKKIATLLEDEPELLRALLECLFHIAAADGVLHPEEDEFLRVVAERFGIGQLEFLTIRASFVHDPHSPYEVLGVRPRSPTPSSRRAIARSSWSTIPTASPPAACRPSSAPPPTGGLPPSTPPTTRSSRSQARRGPLHARGAAMILKAAPRHRLVGAVHASPNVGERRAGCRPTSSCCTTPACRRRRRRSTGSPNPTARSPATTWSTRRAPSRRWCRKRSAPGTRAPRIGPARRTSIRPPSASRFRTPATRTAIPISGRADAGDRRAVPRHHGAPRHPPRGRARPFRRGAGAQDRPRREVRLGRPLASRRRPLGGAVAAGLRLRPACSATRGPRSPRRRRCCAATATTSRRGAIDERTRVVVRTFQQHFRQRAPMAASTPARSTPCAASSPRSLPRRRAERQPSAPFRSAGGDRN